MIDILLIIDDYNETLNSKKTTELLNSIYKNIIQLKDSSQLKMFADNFRNRTAILMLIQLNNKTSIKCIQHLLSINCDIHACDNEGLNAVHIATESPNVRILDILFKNNVNFIRKSNVNGSGKIALQMAIQSAIAVHKQNSVHMHKYHALVCMLTKYSLLQGLKLNV